MSNDESVRAQTLPDRVNLAHLAGLEDATEQALLMSLDVYEEAIFRTTYQDGRPVATDEVSPLELAQALASIDAGTGLLPPDTLFYRQSGGEYHLAVYLPPVALRPLRLDGEPEPVVTPLPPLVFAGWGTDYHVYALATEGWPAAETPLYHAPFPNVHTKGRICSGSVKFPACRPNTIHRAARLFFESRFNQDLARGKSRRHETIVELWRELDGMGIEQYPLDDLVGMGQVLGDLLSQ